MLALTIREKNGEERQLIFDKEEVTIGRATGSDIVLSRSNISKRHARLVDKHEKVVIVDLRSTNGTYVNGRRITAPELLTYEDKVFVGDFVIRLARPAEQDDAHRMTAPYEAGPPPDEARADEPRVARAATAAVMPPMPAAAHAPAVPPPMPTAPPMSPPLPPAPVARATQPPMPPVAPLPPVAPAIQPPMPPLSAPPAPVARATQPEALPASIEDEDATRALSVMPDEPEDEDATRALSVMPDEPEDEDATRALEGMPDEPEDEPEPVASEPAAGAAVAQGGPSAAEIAAAEAELDREFAALAALEEPASEGAPASAVPAPNAAEEPSLRAEIPRENRKVGTIHDSHVRSARPAPPVALTPPPAVREDDPWEAWNAAVAQVIAAVDVQAVGGQDALEHLIDATIVRLMHSGALAAATDRAALRVDVASELLGTGPIGELIADPTVQAVYLNGPRAITVERDGGATEPSGRVFATEDTYRGALARLIGDPGEEPIPNVPETIRLGDGTWLSYALPSYGVAPVAVWRRATPRMLHGDLASRVADGLLSEAEARTLSAAVQTGGNVLVVGPRSDASRAVLAALATECGLGKRAILASSDPSLFLEHPNHVRLPLAEWNQAQLDVMSSDLLVFSPLEAQHLRAWLTEALLGARSVYAWRATPMGLPAGRTLERMAAALGLLGDGYTPQNAGAALTAAIDVIVVADEFGAGVQGIYTPEVSEGGAIKLVPARVPR